MPTPLCAICHNEPANDDFPIQTSIKAPSESGGRKTIYKKDHGYVGNSCIAAVRNGADPLRQLNIFEWTSA